MLSRLFIHIASCLYEKERNETYYVLMCSRRRIIISIRVSLAPLVLGEQLSTSYSIIVVLSTSVDDVKENFKLSSESSIRFGIRRLDSERVVSSEAFRTLMEHPISFTVL